MWSSFDFASLLFAMAAIIGVLNERFLRLPRPIALLIGALLASLGIMAFSALMPTEDIVGLSQRRIARADLPNVLLDGVLALLLFAASLQVDMAGLKRRARPIFVLATIGVCIATILFGLGMWAIFALAGIDVPFAWCLVLGAILAPTDAVAVEQLLHRVWLPRELRTLISGESLFNDGAAVVLFFAALAMAKGDANVVGHGHLLAKFVIGGAGGALLGYIAGSLAAHAMRLVGDGPLVVTISLALALATYRMAVVFDLSGPIAVVVAGLTLLHSGRHATADDAWRRRLHEFWSMADELVNTLLFLFMGFEILAIPLDAAGIAPVLAAIPLALVARSVSVAVPVYFQRRPGGPRAAVIGVLTWTGLRGGISVAMVLSLPEGPYRDPLAVVCYAVVIFTVVVQGLTTPRVVAALFGKAPPVLEAR